MNEYIGEKYFPARVEIDAEAYHAIINGLSPQEALYKAEYDNINVKYYKIVQFEEVDASVFLQDKMLERLEKMSRNISIITGIVIFSLICSLISVIALLAYFINAQG